MAKEIDYSRFENLTFNDFRAMALEENLSKYEKIGFPDSYRSGKEKAILNDIVFKLPALCEQSSIILDIGCGCSDLPYFLMEQAVSLNQTLLLLDSEEMLNLLSPIKGGEKNIFKVAAHYPDCPDLFAEKAGRVNAILIYSVLQYVFAEGNIFEFLDRSLTLLAPGGRMLIGDIPNISMRKRFFASETGIAHHQSFTGTTDIPNVTFNHIEHSLIDDSVVIGLLARARSAGFQAFIVPQSSDLPMANRREDLLIIRP
jgi:cyclopropane fatty-acyl-phospholipid synthase-like methyltransferase